MRVIAISLFAAILVSACSRDTGPVPQFGSVDSSGPDARTLVPQNPLRMPATATLPKPTPGGTNLADR